MATYLLTWGLLGALIGLHAAQRKGWNLVAGALGGIFLGPLAFLLYFMSGLVSSSESNRKRCEFCREWMWADATVCPRCQRAVTAASQVAAPPTPSTASMSPPRPGSRKSVSWITAAGIAALVAGLAVVAWALVVRADRAAVVEREAAVAKVREEYSALLAKPAVPAAVSAPAANTPSTTPTGFDYPDQRAEVIALRLQVAQLQALVAAAQDETNRHRQGLERAVAELNRLRSAAIPAYSPPAAAPRPRARVSQYTAPQIVVSDSGIQVNGRLWNSSDVDAVGSITIELLLDAKPYDSARQEMRVPANSEMVYSHTFFRGPSQGTYSARVTPEY